MSNEPLAYLITWTVYGTFLQGDQRGWRRRGEGAQSPQPQLARWRRERLRHSVELLSDSQRSVLETEIVRLAAHRGWRVWAQSVQPDHVHVVVTAESMAGDKVRDQLKANCTRAIRAQWQQFVDRPIWTTGGDWRCVNSDDDLKNAVVYVSVAQDRKHRDRR